MRKITSLVLAFLLLFSVGFIGANGAHAQTTYDVSGTGAATVPGTTVAPAGTVTTPGVPTTGAGGEMALNIAILLASGLVAVGGVAYLFRRVRTS